MFKKVEAKIVHRGRYYFVIVQEYRSFLGIRIWQTGWKETAPRFLTRIEAEKLRRNIKPYLKGKYTPAHAGESRKTKTIL